MYIMSQQVPSYMQRRLLPIPGLRDHYKLVGGGLDYVSYFLSAEMLFLTLRRSKIFIFLEVFFPSAKLDAKLGLVVICSLMNRAKKGFANLNSI